MKNLIFLFKLSFIIVFFTQCTASVPIHIVKIKPLFSEEVIYQNGTSFLVKTKDSINVNIFPDIESYPKEYISFIVQIKNNSMDTILFNPTNSRIILTNQKNETNTFRAYNPEFMISQLNDLVAMNEKLYQENQKNLASSERSQGTAQMLNGVSSLVNIFNRDKKSRDETREEIEQRRDDLRRQENDLKDRKQQNTYEYQQRNEMIQKEMENWRNNTIRITHIFPFQTIQGAICFPKIPENGKIRFYLPIKATSFQFDFIQEVTTY